MPRGLDVRAADTVTNGAPQDDGDDDNLPDTEIIKEVRCHPAESNMALTLCSNPPLPHVL